MITFARSYLYFDHHFDVAKKESKSEIYESAYLIFVIFFTRAKLLESKIYTEKRQFFALNL